MTTSSVARSWKDGSFRNAAGEFLALWLGNEGKWQLPPKSVLFQWALTRKLPELPTSPDVFPIIKPRWAHLQQAASPLKCTWIGHATCFLQINGIKILTDPVFSERCSPVQFAGPKRYTPTACTVQELPGVDLVLISHNHYDHLDWGSIADLEKQFRPVYACGLGLGDWFTKTAALSIPPERVIEFDWWQEKSFRPQNSSVDVSLTFVPVQHWSKRWLWDDFQSLWGGFAVKSQHVADGDAKSEATTPPLSFFFNGDTGYHEELYAEIGRRCGPFDISAIPIGAYEPRSIMQVQHVDPEEAFLIHKQLKSRYSFGIHHGTFILTDEPLKEPTERIQKVYTEECAKASASGNQEAVYPFEAIKHGATVVMEPSSRLFRLIE